jgi:hypothetical protein
MSTTTPLDLLKQHRPKGMSCDQIVAHIASRGTSLSRQCVESWLAGRRRISMFAFNAMAEAFDMPEADRRLGRMMVRDELEESDAAPPKRTDTVAVGA